MTGKISRRIPYLAYISSISILIAMTTTDLSAQNITISNPTTSISDSFHENLGVNFGFGIPGGRGSGSRVVGLSPTGQLMPNLIFSQGPGVAPVYGGYDPNAAARFGFGNGNFSLGLNLSRGNTRTVSNVTPSLTVQNGFGGSMFSGSYRPFATSVTPVVGGYLPPSFPVYQPDNGVTRAINSGQLDLSYTPSESDGRLDFSHAVFSDPNSSATRGDLPVREIKAIRAAAIAKAKAEFETRIDEAESAELQQNYSQAEKSYREALKMIQDRSSREVLKRKIRAMRNQSKAQQSDN